MTDDGRESYKAYLKYLTAAALMAAWVLAAWTGFMLGVIPYAQGSGSETHVLGLTRGELGAIHSWLSAFAVLITAVEIMITREFLAEGIRNLSEARIEQPGE